MNKIEAKIDVSDFEGIDNYLNIKIDNKWLDETLEYLHPNNFLKGLVPTLLFWMEIDQEIDVVWKRILPNPGIVSFCPILMCPDDCDFSCTLIIAEIENKDDHIFWNKLGLDKTYELNPEMVGSTVDWFETPTGLCFDMKEYKKLIQSFKNDFQLKQKAWNSKNTN